MSDLESSSKWSKMLKDPIPLIGLSGLVGVVGYSLLKYKNKRSTTSTSLYVIQTRVAAQGLVIGLLTIGLGYRMFNSLMHPELRPNHHHQIEEAEHNRQQAAHNNNHQHK